MWERDHVEKERASGKRQMSVKEQASTKWASKGDLGAKKGKGEGKAALHDTFPLVSYVSIAEWAVSDLDTFLTEHLEGTLSRSEGSVNLDSASWTNSSIAEQFYYGHAVTPGV